MAKHGQRDPPPKPFKNFIAFFGPLWHPLRDFPRFRDFSRFFKKVQDFSSCQELSRFKTQPCIQNLAPCIGVATPPLPAHSTDPPWTRGTAFLEKKRSLTPTRLSEGTAWLGFLQAARKPPGQETARRFPQDQSHLDRKAGIGRLSKTDKKRHHYRFQPPVRSPLEFT